MTSVIGKHALIVGASIAGASAAGALSKFFEKITIVDRDSVPEKSVQRAGAPQGKHVHGLMAGGLRAMESLLPGFTEALIEAGGVRSCIGLDGNFEQVPFSPFPQRDLGIVSYTASRPLTEWTLREKALSLVNVTLRHRITVSELLLDEAGEKVVGANIKNEDGQSEQIMADLVIDASGRGELTLALLEATNRAAPDTTRIGVDLGYSSAVFQIPDNPTRGWASAMLIPDAPASSRGALMLPIENNQWMLSIVGREGDYPPAEPDAFMDFVRNLRTPTIYNAIVDAKRVGDIQRFRFKESIWRHYENVQSFPDGFLPMGDAICRINPIYGQAMSIAALEAQALQVILSERLDLDRPLSELWKPYFIACAEVIDTPWSMSAIPDFIYPATRGDRPENFEISLKFGAALNQLAAVDPSVHKIMQEVRHLIRPRSAYHEPSLLQRVLEKMEEEDLVDESVEEA
jgi:2-polyprenyl-6-methoxyphenol hydroxylase-like FAD-dependent oxidoreductase